MVAVEDLSELIVAAKELHIKGLEDVVSMDITMYSFLIIATF